MKKCKFCEFIGTEEQVISHALDIHQEMMADAVGEFSSKCAICGDDISCIPHGYRNGIYMIRLYCDDCLGDWEDVTDNLMTDVEE